MKSILHLFGNIFSLACTEPIVSDTYLKGENLEVLKERVFKGIDGSFGVEILGSGLIEAVAFPPAIPCPELVLECISRYDPISETIRRDNGETLLAINHRVISSIFRLPDYQFLNFSLTQLITEFNVDRTGHRNIVEKYWLKVPQRGGSRLPKNPNKNHMLPHIHDVMLLLHRVRGSMEAYSFDDWIYCYVQLVLEGKQYLNWAELIADSMKE
ncbi:hypothetical protein SUGI_0839700 [Cryptomeria japonica]|nr:hypothetical protein SUGI_0839700 [Cryptomeria japonica]